MEGVGGQAWKLRAALVGAAAALLILGSAAAMVAGSTAAPATHLAGGSPSPSPSSDVSDTLTTTVLRAVTVHSGSTATVTYRADDDDASGGVVTIDLLVTTRSGEVRRHLVTDRPTVVGVVRSWRGRLRLRRGRYRLIARAVDANGRREASARFATLRVLAPLPPLVPTARARRAAFAWAARRAGNVAVAVVDSRGRQYGYRQRRPFMTASVVKAMLLVAWLRRHRTIAPGTRAQLTRMITISDNDAADAVYRSVGRRGLMRFARAARMSSFRAGRAWIVSRVNAADMARFFRDMERYVPVRHRRFANGLLTHIVAWQRWGIPEAAGRRGYRVYCKPGWLGAWTLASEAARLERGRIRIGLAVFTDRNPTSSYGKETVAGVTERLLRR